MVTNDYKTWNVKFYELIEKTEKDLDLVVLGPTPAIARNPDIYERFNRPEHILTKKQKAGVRLRMICLEWPFAKQFLYTQSC